MEKLLQWSTAQQSSDPEVRAQAPAPDPKLAFGTSSRRRYRQG